MNKKFNEELTHDSGKEFYAQAAVNAPTLHDILIECATLLHAHDFDYFYVIENHRIKKTLLAVRLNIEPKMFESSFQPEHAKKWFEEMDQPGYEGYLYYDYYIETPPYCTPLPVVLFDLDIWQKTP